MADRKPRPPGATTARGYGTAHQKLRAKIAPQVNAGLYHCAECKTRIMPGEPWHLGHSQFAPIPRNGAPRRALYIGPVHKDCNESPPDHKPRKRRPEPPALAFFKPSDPRDPGGACAPPKLPDKRRANTRQGGAEGYDAIPAN